MTGRSRFASAPVRPRPRLDARWLRYLIVSGHTDAEIQSQLVADDLPSINERDLLAYRQSLVVPLNFIPHNHTHVETLRFLYAEGIEPFYRRDARDADAVLRLLRTRRARELVEAALIADVPLDSVVPVLSERLAFSTEERLLKLYRAVFFDCGHLSRAQLRVLVEARVRAAVLGLVEEENHGAVRRAVAADARVIATGMPTSRLAWAAALLAFGWQAPRYELAATLDEIENTALVRANEAAVRNNHDDDRRTAGFVGVVEKVRQIRETLAAPATSLRDTLKLHLVQRAENIPTVAELAAKGEPVASVDTMRPIPTPVGSSEEGT